MSDLQDLIHKTVMDCIEKGKEMERQRIIKLISGWDFPVNQGTYTVNDSVKSLIALIEGEQK